MQTTTDVAEAYRQDSPRRTPASRLSGTVLVLAMAVAAAFMTMAGCAGPASSPAPTALSPVAITDFRAVAGRWAGPVRGLASRRSDEDWVELTIAQDGAYEFGIARNIGMFAGRGRFTLDDGKLVMVGERGRATYALYEGEGRRMLRANGVLTNGAPVSAELSAQR